ncbi:sushi, von Willebrand factor type A, EGF and pentraxin domain-containing protein 1-like isoform X2 [Acropora muricata]|uniref:sushi, von Willebrand factor type A, EGF and pentraxin domain-containing protein 1-like isoform X2 n=1 Tax=Acropora muricata TaxID=159855 RepID=UPI0034E4516D
MRMWKRALTFAVLVFICPNIECKRKTDDSKKSVDCRRTNKSAFRFCTKACKSHNDCKKNQRCLCDGDCGMACVRNNLKCNELKKTKNMIAKVSNGRSFGSVITYSCPSPYTLRGPSKRSCRAIGEWDGRKTRCRKFCRDPGEITHGNRRYTSFQVGKYITYWCFPGYNMTGNAKITCEEDRSTGNPRWSSNKPICQLPTCPRPTIPRNALIDFPRKMPKNFNYNQRVLLKCMYGYVKTSLGILACRGPSWIGGISCRPKSCGSPSEVANGRILGYLYTFKQRVTYACDEGYQIRGPLYRQCQANGKWGGDDPSCDVVNCGPLQRPDHGDIIQQVGTTFGNRIVFECTDKGYEIRGSKVRTCQSDGSWSGLPTTCELVKCDDPGTPVNGMRIVSKGLVYGGSLRFKCNRDYTLTKGMSEIIYCQATKRWTASVPQCLAPCRDPGLPRQGNRIGDDFRHDSKVTFSCPNGFLMEGVGEISCSNGTWSNRVPACKAPCVKLSRPANGYMSGDFRHGSQVRFDCYYRYQRIGAASSTCNDGTWSNSAPICKGICGRPRVSSRVHVHGNSFLDGDEVQFSCIANYDLFGSQRSRCVGQRWNTGIPECKARCIFGGDPDNGFAVRNAFSYRMVKHGVQIVYRCNEHYTLIGSATQRCNNGRWTNSRPSCNAPCRDPGVPREGSRTGDDFRHGREVIFTCRGDYLMEGVREISCSNGAWSNRVPTCKAPCVKLSRPANGYMSGDFKHRNQVRFVCYYGYQRIGAASSTCNDGTWSNSAPICKGRCGRPRVSSRAPLKLHGNSFLDGDELQFSCIANYDLFGSQRIRCVGRRWNAGIPECKARCIFEGDPDNGLAVRDAFFNRVVTHGVQITYRCNENYTLIGSATQRCNNGRWTNSRPSCEAPCQWPGRIDNGRNVGHSYKHGDTVQYVCNKGYILDGKQNLTCADGVWSSHRPACRASCRRPEPQRNGGMRGANFHHNEKVVFYCDENYQLVGESEITCKDGSWSDSYPTCVATCSNPGEPAHGRRLSNDFQDGRTVVFECDEGFDLFGNKAILCIGSLWNASIPECKATCPNPGRPAHGRRLSNDFQDGRTVAFECDEGFDLFGNKAILCSGGSWNASMPECKASCNNPGDIAHGQLTSQYFSHGQLVRYKCDLGYSLEGNNELTCNNGDWNSNLPNCKACQNPIGMENLSTRNIRITSADYLNSPNIARLNGRLAWCTTKQTYLQVKLDKRHQLTAIATQGGQDNTGIIRWVRKYKLGFFAGPRKEIFYQESGTQQVIDGNENATSTITYFFKEPFITEVVRIYPNFHSTPVCLRMELYGCDPNPDCIHVGSVVWGLWERKGDSLSYYLVYITQLNATHVDFVLDYYAGKLLTRSYNRSDPVLVVDKTPKMTDISVGSRVIGVHKPTHTEWYKNGTVIRTWGSTYAYVRFNSTTRRWVRPRELRLEKRPRFCTTSA